MKSKTQKLINSITFRKWAGKSWSLFNVLKKVVRIGFLTVIYHQSVAEIKPEIGADTSKLIIQHELEEIEISATRNPVNYSEVARVITIISKAELQRMPGGSLADILEYLPGIDIRQRGPAGVQADISFRGGTFDQSLILLNGINVTDPQTGHHNLNIPVSYEQIERIEVIEGSSSIIYGPNGFSGAINIITFQPVSNSISGQLEYGEYNFKSLNLSGSVKTGRFANYLALGNKSSEGYVGNTDFKTANIFYSTTADYRSGKLAAQVGFTEKGFGANAFYTPKYPEQYEETRTMLASVKWESVSLLHFSPIVYWRRQHDRFELFRYDHPKWYKQHNYHLTNVYGAMINSWLINAAGKTSMGAQARSENIISNVLGEKMASPIRVPGENALFTHSSSRLAISLFLEHTIKINNLTTSLALQTLKNTDSKISWKIYPVVNLDYHLNYYHFYLTAGKSQRMPTFTDLYYSGPTNIGNPGLIPETMHFWETGMKFNNKTIKGNISLFHQNGKDLIDWIKLPAEEKWTTMNLTETRNSGIQLNLHLFMEAIAGKKFFITDVSVGFLKNHLKKDQSPYISYYVLDNLNYKLNLMVNHKIFRKLYANWNLVAQDRNGTYTAYNSKGWGDEMEYSQFWLIDGKMNYQYKAFSLYVSASNALNTRYLDFGNIFQPGRWIKAGVQFDLAFRKLYQ